MTVNVIPNDSVKQIFIGTPPNHKHLRVLIQNGENWQILSEATVANLVRAFIEIKTHPLKETVQFKQILVTEQKKNFADYQLLEEPKSENELQEEFDKLWENLTAVTS